MTERLARKAILFILTGLWAQAASAQLDENWTVAVNGQTVQVRSDGTFFIPNVSAPDRFGAGGPGTAPDFFSDNCLRVIGSSTQGGVTRWVTSEPFQFQEVCPGGASTCSPFLRRPTTFQIGELTISDTPPVLPVSLDLHVLAGNPDTLTALGQTTQLEVLATMADGSVQNLTAADEGCGSFRTTYNVSNLSVANVTSSGLVTATGSGAAFITASNSGVTAVKRLIVSPGDPLTTLEGFVQLPDGTPVAGAEVTILALPGSDVSDAAGFFSIPGVPSQLGQDLTLRAGVEVGSQSYVGSVTGVMPIGGMITDVGIITVVTTGGGLGPVVLSGMDPEDHGTPGQEMIRDLMSFIVSESGLHANPSRIAMLGGSTSVANNARSIAQSLGFTLDHFAAQAILGVELSPSVTNYDAIYMPTGSQDISGGITATEMALINQRGPAIVRFVNSGGGLAAFAQNVSGGFGWMPLEGLQTVNLGGGGQNGIMLTPEGVFLLSPSATAVQPFHQAFIGPPGFYGLSVLAFESFGQMRPLIIGGLASIPPDCNGNDVLDTVDLVNGTSGDCNSNGIPDECDDDCNTNGIADECDVSAGTSADLIGPGAVGDGVPDECQPDCNGNLIPDPREILNGSSLDCNTNGVPDTCDLASGTSLDCNGNGVPDSCDIAAGRSEDCQLNGVPDACDIASGASDDCDGNNVPDECDQDCNGNGEPDTCDIATGASPDCDGNSFPDECDIAGGAPDCNGNGVPDECDIGGGTSVDLIGAGGAPDGVPDECQSDCNANSIPDELDLSASTSSDCNANAMPDECDTMDGTSQDCNGNSIPDECDVRETVTYSITLGNLVGVDCSCSAVSVYNCCSGPTGFAWSDLGGGDVASVKVEFNVGVECHNAGSVRQTSLNGHPDVTYPSTQPFCSCGTTAGVPVTLNLSPGNYNRGGANTFLITNPTTCLGFIPSATFGTGVYARVTVTYDASDVDCNGNHVPDSCDIASGASGDANGNQVPDECEGDCNSNGVPDADEIAGGSADCNNNGVLDECEADCNGNGVPDGCDLAAGTSADCQSNGIPDECETPDPGTVGACCGLPAGCSIMSQSACESSSGEYLGNCTTCGICGPSDNCGNAPLTTDGLHYFDTTNAATDGPSHPGCAAFSFGDDQVHRDVWLEYRATCNGELTATTCEDLGGSANFDTRIVIYREDVACPVSDADMIACNDDDPSNLCGTAQGGYRSTVSTSVNQGMTYLIRVGGFSDADFGSGQLLLECTPGD